MPADAETRVINIRLSEQDLREIDAIAAEENRPRANLLVTWIKEALAARRSKKGRRGGGD